MRDIVGEAAPRRQPAPVGSEIRRSFSVFWIVSSFLVWDERILSQNGLRAGTIAGRLGFLGFGHHGTRLLTMRRYYYFLLTLPLLLSAVSCGSGSNGPQNVGLFGNWNVAMYANNDPNPVFVFAMAMSQEGSSTFSGASIAYNGSVPVPSNMCINGSSLRATATTSSDNTFTMTITDSTSNTIISVQGSLSSQTTTLSGTYTNAASQSCTQSQGSMTMVPQ
jgi:hypothetical protein